MLDLDFEVPSWDEVHGMLVELAGKIQKNRFKPEAIVGISRGGWIPARILSDLLEVDFITTLKVEFYVDINKTLNKPRLTQRIPVSISNKKILLVDDIVDTGKSAALARDYLSRKDAGETRFLSLYSKPWSIFKPDFCGRETSSWVVFPWELRETLVKLRRKSEGSPEIFFAAVNKLIARGFEGKLVDHLLSYDCGT